MLTTFELQHVKNIYEEIASHFSNTRVHSWSWITTFVTSLPPNSTICDVGCGNGRNMHFPEYNFIGVDNCHAFLQICRSKGLNVVEANITSIPIKSNTFDAVICIAVLHHLYTDESKIEALRELKRIVKVGGKILISVWSIKQPLKTRRVFKNHGHNFVDWDKFGKKYNRYYYIFKEDEIKRLFALAGLNILNQTHDCGNEVWTLIRID